MSAIGKYTTPDHPLTVQQHVIIRAARNLDRLEALALIRGAYTHDDGSWASLGEALEILAAIQADGVVNLKRIDEAQEATAAMFQACKATLAYIGDRDKDWQSIVSERNSDADIQDIQDMQEENALRNRLRAALTMALAADLG